MSGGANIVEQYAGADAPARIELLIKYYPNFTVMICTEIKVEGVSDYHGSKENWYIP